MHTRFNEISTHTSYYPGGFVPLLQINRSEQCHTNPVECPRAMVGSDDQEVVLPPGFHLSNLLPQDMREQVQESLQLLKKAQTHTEDAHPLAIRHILTDHLGTPIALVNANGQAARQVSWTARYSVWGIEQEYNPHRIHQPIRLQGQQLDAETGLHYNRFRYYDPGVGQYVTQDPIGLLGGTNGSSYVDHDSLNSVDPLGLFDLKNRGPVNFPTRPGPGQKSMCATAECAAGLPPANSSKPELPPIQVKPTSGMTCSYRGGVGPIGATVEYNNENGVQYVGVGPQAGLSASCTAAGQELVVGSGPKGIIIQGNASAGNGMLGISAKAAGGVGGLSGKISPGVGTVGVSTGVTIGYKP
ncbi:MULTISPECIES: RHS repeat domain-containing protein [unclassified Acidovorax]|uniref:RHS repeat domain-containing protein n=1 Tax=unclassified Acidovorax TaxID=2684926 RepID=UPI0009E6BFD8|nr:MULTISPECIES: RHS repeat-associated core domain-containing protein [unclassified Acidovorax]